MKKIFTLFVAFLALTFCAKAQVTIILEAHDVWGDGSGYQLLLDADHNTYGTIIPETGALTTSGDVPDSVYAEFEYKVPVNADGSLTTQNMVYDGSATITIPAGTYDFCITNPTPNDKMWIPGDGIDPTRADDYVFVDGNTYHFLMVLNGSNDGCQLTVTINPTSPMIVPSPTAMNFDTLSLGDIGNATVTVNNYLLTSDVTATTAAPFEISADGITYGTTASIPAAGGTINVRYAPTVVGTDNGTITLSSTGASDVTVALTGSAIDCSNTLIPYSYSFDDASANICWGIVDANNDGSTFNFSVEDGMAFYRYNSANAADDWLMSPYFAFDGSQFASFDYAARSATYPETFQVFAIGADTVALTEVMTVDNTDFQTQYLDLSELNGSYSIAIHCVSSPDEWYLYISNFNVAAMTVPEVSVSGPSDLELGVAGTFTATAPLATSFAWTIDGVAVASTTDTLTYTFTTVGSHTLNVTVTNSVGSATASHTVNVFSCDEVHSLPFFEGFENGLPQCWQNLDNDGDGYYWDPSFMYQTEGAAHSGDGMISSASYINNTGALTPDNWLITPAVSLTSNATLSFWVRAQDEHWPGEHYGVYISTTGTDSTDFSLLFEETLDENSGAKVSTPWKQKSINLDDYTGQTVRIAFRHFNCYDQFYLNLDDVEISDLPSITAAPSTLIISTFAGGQNTASATVNGINLTTGITATTTAPFSVSADGTNFGATANLPAAGGTLYIQYTSTGAGLEYGTVTLSSSGADDATIMLTGKALEFATLPFSTDFEDAEENSSWEIASSSSNQWVFGTAANATEDGQYALYVSNDNGTTNAYTITNASVSWVYRDLDFGQYSEYQLAFDFRGIGENNYDYLKIYLGYPTEVSASSYDAPVGATLVGTYTNISDWTHYDVSLPSSFSGLQRLYLLWRNDNTVGTNPPAAIDNLSIVGNNCAAPVAPAINDVTAYAADLTFQPATPTDDTWEYLLYTDPQQPEDLTPVTLSDTIANLTGLIPNTTYHICLRTVCDNNEFSAWSNVITFTTEPICTSPTSLVVSQVTGTSAMVTWEPAELGATAYVISYKEAGQENWISETVTDLQYMLTGLTPTTSYSVMVSSVCDEGSAPAVSRNFNTHCLAGGEIPIGEGTSTNNYIPSYSYYNYGYSQQLFTASEFNGPTDLTSISMNLATLTKQRTYHIYLAHTTATDLDSAWASTADAQLVYTGPQTLTTGWNTFDFIAPFSYNGTDNLLVIFVDSTGSYLTGNSWYVHSTPSSYARYMYQDGAAYPLEPASATSGTAVTVRNNVIFGGDCDETATCIAPNAFLSDITSGSLTLNWVAGNTEDSWEVEYSTDTADWISEGVVTSSPYIIDNLDAFTMYTVRIRSICDNGEFSDWKTMQATTGFCDASDQCAYTINLIDSYGDGWNGGTLEVQQNGITVATLGLSSGSSATDTVFLCQDMPTSLVWHSGSYDYEAGFAIVSPYGEEIFAIGNMSDYTTYTFSSSCIQPTCLKPVDITVSNTSATTAEVSWTSTGTETAWNLEYKESGDEYWTVIPVSTNPYTLTNLTPATYFDVRVQADCGEGNVSLWSSVATFSTTLMPVDLPYTADFSNPNDIWFLNNGSCANYWTTGTVDNEDALFVTFDSLTPGYDITSVSTISAQKLFTVGTSPTITISYDVQVGGESSYDYMKMFLAPATMDFPASTTAPTSSDYAYNSYSDYAYDFLTNEFGTNANYPFILNLVDSTIHVQATMANPNANPDANSTALLVFAWKNDQSLGSQPAAIIKNLTVTPAHTTTDEATICASSLPYEWNGVTFYENGVQTAVLQTVDGGDSVVTMTLTVNEVYAVNDTKYVCPSELPYEWNGVTFTAAGIQTVTLTAANGCDSVVTMSLNINPTYTVTDSRTICQSELPYEWNGVTFTAAGAQIATLESTNGCDSVVVMSLTVNEVYDVNETVALCPSEFPYVWNGLTFAESGTQSITLQTVSGCDSVLTMTVTMNNGYAVNDTRYVCPSELPYEWNGETFTAAGVQTVTLTAANGCDSVVTMSLNINLTYTVTDSRTICQSELPYEWNGVTFTAAGVQTATLQTVNGCDSVVVMILTVPETITSEFTIETSDSCYEWNSQIYCASGNYTQTFTAANGCDSVVTLHLTTSVGVVNHELGTSLYLAPNPTKSISRIIGLDESLKYVDVMDMSGRLMMKRFDSEIDVSTLPAGVYVVKVFTERGITNLKLVKQ